MAMVNHIYLDYAATTPVDPRVVSAMLPYFNDTFGNPSSVHRKGQQAEAAVESARESISVEIHCQPEEIIFTSCGSESDNLALRGTALARREIAGVNRIVTSHAEHHAISKTAQQLEKHFGFEVDWLETDETGTISPEMIRAAVTEDTAIVSVMYANNEIGTINPVAEIAEICRLHKIPFHTDAVQAAAYLPVNVQPLGADLMSLGAHKFYGPKGVGALYVRKGTPIFSTQTGGGQEAGLRAGTLNVPYIIGFAEALRLTSQEQKQRIYQVQPLRDRIIGTVLEEIPASRLTGHPVNRLPNHCSFAFKDLDGNLLLTLLDQAGFACSSGSACKTGNPEPSEVMEGIGLPREWGLGSLRVTLGTGTTSSDVEAFLEILPDTIRKARELSGINRDKGLELVNNA
jgi:cysteine desulfurase